MARLIIITSAFGNSARDLVRAISNTHNIDASQASARLIKQLVDPHPLLQQRLSLNGGLSLFPDLILRSTPPTLTDDYRDCLFYDSHKNDYRVPYARIRNAIYSKDSTCYLLLRTNEQARNMRRRYPDALILNINHTYEALEKWYREKWFDVGIEDGYRAYIDGAPDIGMYSLREKLEREDRRYSETIDVYDSVLLNTGDTELLTTQLKNIEHTLLYNDSAEQIFIDGQLYNVPHENHATKAAMLRHLRIYPYRRSVFIVCSFKGIESIREALRSSARIVGWDAIFADEHNIVKDNQIPTACLLCCSKIFAVFDSAAVDEIVFNPNVCYELGIGFYLKKDVKIMWHPSLGAKPPFDFQQQTYEEYHSIETVPGLLENWLRGLGDEN